MNDLVRQKNKIEETTDYLISKGFLNPEIGIVLGTGLGQMVNEIEKLSEVDYSEIPWFPEATVEYHSGKLIYGIIEGKKVVVMQGRFHLYEGYDPWDVTYGVRVMHQLGIRILMLSNAAGTVNPDFCKGDLMILDDHINLQGVSPLAFSNVSDFGDQFVDMIEPYDNRLNEKMKNIAYRQNIRLKEGIYAAVIGPHLETRAEYRMIRILGADAVGMSTVPEVIVAKHLGLSCVAISVLTDECDPDNLKPINIPEIMQIAKEAEVNLVLLYKSFIKQL